MHTSCRYVIIPVALFTLFVHLACTTTARNEDLESSFHATRPNVIFIHGYGNLFAPNSSIMKTVMTKYYWKNWADKAFHNVDVKYINWDSTQRIEEQLGEIVSQFTSHLKNNHCDNGCIVVTHSTGGLVIDMLLARALESRGKTNDFSEIWDATIFTLNIASAAGGVGLATTLSDIVMGNCNSLITSLLPFVECGNPASMGAGHDLRPNEARFINHSDNVRTPSLMIAGSGFMTPTAIRSQLLGTNDGLVAMHSACGGNSYPSSTENAPESCSPYQASDGSIKKQNAPTLYRQHYPIIMTEEGHLSQLYKNLLYFDFLKDKKESLIFFNDDGKIIAPPEQFNSLEITTSQTDDTDDPHLPQLVGELFGLGRGDEPNRKSENSSKPAQRDFLLNLQAIGKAYEKSLQYPLYSRPLYPTDKSLLAPNKFFIEHKYFDNDSYSAAIVLPRYLMFKGAKIPVNLHVQNHDDKQLPHIETVIAEILANDGVVVFSSNLSLVKSDHREMWYHSELQLTKTLEEILPDDINLKITFTTNDGEKQVLTKMFKYLPAIGSITDKGTESVEDQHLVIPINIQVKKPGNYKLTANLFSQKDGEPIAHLMGESLIPTTSGSILLKVHAKVLRLKNNPGPYLLKSLMLTRIPDTFGEQRMFGDCKDMEFSMRAFNLANYSALPYTDIKEQKKLNKFQNLTSSP